MSFFYDNYGAIRYPYETEENKGLRKSQLGAIHSIASHFTNSNTPAIITMPTGSGKTAILILAAFVLRVKRVLVLTPSRLVRTQIKEEFEELNTLLEIGALVDIQNRPKVCELRSKILSEDAWKELENYDVTVTTPMSISPAIDDVPNPPYDIFDLILIDEAHHSPATTWNRIIETFPNAHKILFTATPFRRDKKDIKGKFIYNYAISDAYKEGAFGQVQYVPVTSTGANEDIDIAKKAEEILVSDRESGYNHLLMVRTDTKKRAKELKEIYQQNTSLRLQSVNSDHSYKHIKSILKKLIDRELDGIICVNMFGEGFNLPSLKIAAIHSPHKSLEVTLQFIGRFARTNAPNLGVAKFIAIPSEIEIERERMYEEGAVWQDIIMNLSENRIDEEIENRQTLSTFGCVFNKDDETEDLSLLSLIPFAHVRIYSADTFDPNAEVLFPNNLLLVSKHISEEHSMVVLITKEITNPKWTKLNMFQKIQYELFIIYFNIQHKLLFINATRKNEDIYQNIAEKYCGTNIRKLSLSKINRVLSNLKKPEFFNIGMRNSIQTSNTESYRIISGSNAQKAIRKTDGRLYHRGHCFGKGFDNNDEITVGYSSGSKVWSNAYLTIPHFIKWCNKLATKINSADQAVTNSPLDFIPISEEVNNIPDKDIIAIDWNNETYIKPPVVSINNEELDNRNMQLLDFDLELKNRINGEIEIEFRHIDFIFSIYFSLETSTYYRSVDELADRVHVYRKHDDVTLVEYLNTNPLALYFNDFSSLVGNEYYKKNYNDFIQIDNNILQIIDWESENVDIQREFGHGNNGKVSIQEFLNRYLAEKNFDFLYFDHGTGEIADFITAKEQENNIIIQFYHCKGSGGEKPGDRVGDIYEVSGQVIKSVLWTDLNKFIRKLKDRMITHERADDNPDSFVRDNIDKLEEILEATTTKYLTFEIVLVQPGISKSGLSEKISNVIAAADDFCVNQGYRPIKVLCSE